jgi:8-oxo-dGTP pyrophosphatase MutT (NUDIX family)
VFSLWRYAGRVAFLCSLPVLWVYLRGTARTRVLLTHKGTVLVVKNWLGNGEWSLPGGGLHGGEPAEIGARRELNEELHLQTSKIMLQSIAVEPHMGKGFSYLCHYLTAECPTLPAIKRQRSEILEYAWLHPSELTPKNASSDVLRALDLCKSH